MFYYSFIYSKLKPDTEAFENTINAYKNILAGLDGMETDLMPEDSDAPLFCFMATGGTEEELLKRADIQERLKRNHPIYLIAHPEYNSLPASLEALARLQMEGAEGQIIYFKSVNDVASMGKIQTLSRSELT